MALARDQQQVLGQIVAIGRKRRVSPMELQAAVETGLVESNLRNLPGGDADSQGWRQERASIYKDPRNLAASINRFFNETGAVRGKYGTAGDLAAAVQRPAAQYRGRYAGVRGQARQLLGQYGGGAGGAAPAAGVAPRVAPALPGQQQVQSPGSDFAAALLSAHMQTQQQPRPSMGLAAPAFSAGPSLPQGAHAVLGGGGPQQSPGSGLTAALAAVSGLGAQQAPAAPAQAGSPAQAAGGVPAVRGAPAGHGMFKITGPNPGRLQPVLVAFARKVAGVYGRTLTGSDGTGHSRLTVDGNVSQHTTGNATDIPATGATLIQMGRAALIAAGMPPAQARKQTGGLFNVGSHQVIFNTHLGGDHTNHLHISAR